MIHSQNKSNVLKNSFVDYNGSWTKKTWASGAGFIVEGKVISKRRHTIKTGNDADLPTRLVAIQIEVVGEIMKREWDPKTGEELVPLVTQNMAKHKGFLHHFDKSEAHAVNTQSVEGILAFIQKMSSVGLVSNDVVSKLHPKARHNLEFWGDQSNFLDLEFNEGDIIRIKTIGDSIIIENLVIVNQLSTNTSSAGGSSTLDNWTSKISKVNVKEEPAEPPRSAEEDAEWD